MLGRNNEITPNTDYADEDEDTLDSGSEIGGNTVEDYFVNIAIYIILLIFIMILLIFCKMIYIENRPDPMRNISLMSSLVVLIGFLYNS